MMAGNHSEPVRRTYESRVPAANPDEAAGSGFAMPVGRILQAIRRHLLLVLAVAALTAGAVLVVLQSPAQYQAIATMRLTGERRATGLGVEEALPAVDRTIAPVLSLMPRIRSRGIVGMVVDSLGLQLRFEPEGSGGFSLSSPELPSVALQAVAVAPDAPADTVDLVFTTDSVRVRQGSGQQTVPYGAVVQLKEAQFAIANAPGLPGGFLRVVPRDVAIDEVLERLLVVPVTGTDAIEVQFIDADPPRAQAVANAIVETFRVATIQAAREQATRRREFLAEQVGETEDLLARAHANLSALRRRQQMASSADRMSVRQSALLALDARRGELEADRQVYRSILEELEQSTGRSGDMLHSPELATHPVIGPLYRRLLDYHTTYDSLTTGPWRAADSNPDLVQLSARMERAYKELTDAVRGQLSSLAQRQQALDNMRTVNADSIQSLPAIQAEESRLEQQVASVASLADQLRLEYQRARMSEQLQTGDIEVVDTAALPRRPIGVPWWLKVAVALAAGLVLASVVALALDVRDRTIRSPEELARFVPVPGLAIIPRVDEAVQVGSGLGALRDRLVGNGHSPGGNHRLVVDSQEPSLGTESFRLLYSSLTLGWGSKQRVIMVTSVAPKDGKTLVASNLAVTFAREGAQVLLIDCDLRRPRIHHTFGLSRSPGLTELLRSNLTVAPPPEDSSPTPPPEAAAVKSRGYFFSMMPESVRTEPSSEAVRSQPAQVKSTRVAHAPPQRSSIRRTGIPGLSVLTCGELPPNPAEVLQAGSIRTLLTAHASDFDVVILDSPPLLVSADAALLAPYVDGVLLVIRAGQTHRAAAARAYEQLLAAGAPMLGTILNDPDGQIAGARELYYEYDYPPTTD